MILVFCELKDGKLRKPSTEALSEGRRLADASGKSLGALFVGASNAGAADAAKCPDAGANIFGGVQQGSGTTTPGFPSGDQSETV